MSSSSAILTCLCGAVSAPGDLLTSPHFPIPLTLCACDDCRYMTGSLGGFFPTLKSSPSPDVFSHLTAYQSSKDFTRYFCSTCGCHCFIVGGNSQKAWCLGGIIEPSRGSRMSWPRDTCLLSGHKYVLDTIDGGLTPFLLDISGRSIPTWAAATPEVSQPKLFDLPHNLVRSLPEKSDGILPELSEDALLTAKCHCGGVSLKIKRANYTSETSGRFVSSDPTKYLTYMCACRSCRLSTGVSLTPWALVPPSNVFNNAAPTSINSKDNLSPVVFGKAASSLEANSGLSLKNHWSSRDVCRSFCGVCGATVFYWCSRRPDELDVAVGIMRAAEGSLARRWLDWDWGRCSFVEESIDCEISEAWSKCAEVIKGE